MKIVIVEDEVRMSGLLQRGLEDEGYVVDVLNRGDDVLPWLQNQPADLLLLDLNLPGQDGLSVCRSLRRSNLSLPILMLTARGAVDERVAGLVAGADDYLPKPFSFEELLARIQALLRRGVPPPRAILTSGRVRLDLEAFQGFVDESNLELSAQEYRVLELLLRQPGRVFSRQQMISHAWKGDFEGDDRVVEVFIHHLRKKLLDAGLEKTVIRTVRGLGYAWDLSS